MAVDVRDATEADLPAVQAVLRATWHATYDRIYGADEVAAISSTWHAPCALARDLGRADAALLVAERSGAIVGTALGRFTAPHTLELSRLYVLPGEQGHGIGRALFQATLARFPGAKHVTLDVAPENAGAITFYERLGFAKAGQSPECGQSGSGSAALLYQLTV
jgi:ribosomal protein S18 acetylase RimI-like enzyme